MSRGKEKNLIFFTYSRDEKEKLKDAQSYK